MVEVLVAFVTDSNVVGCVFHGIPWITWSSSIFPKSSCRRLCWLPHTVARRSCSRMNHTKLWRKATSGGRKKEVDKTRNENWNRFTSSWQRFLGMVSPPSLGAICVLISNKPHYLRPMQLTEQDSSLFTRGLSFSPIMKQSQPMLGLQEFRTPNGLRFHNLRGTSQEHCLDGIVHGLQARP